MRIVASQQFDQRATGSMRVRFPAPSDGKFEGDDDFPGLARDAFQSAPATIGRVWCRPAASRRLDPVSAFGRFRPTGQSPWLLRL